MLQGSELDDAAGRVVEDDVECQRGKAAAMLTGRYNKLSPELGKLEQET